MSGVKVPPKLCFTCGNAGASHSSPLVDKMLFNRDLQGKLIFCKDDFKKVMDDIKDAMRTTVNKLE